MINVPHYLEELTREEEFEDWDLLILVGIWFNGNGLILTWIISGMFHFYFAKKQEIIFNFYTFAAEINIEINYSKYSIVYINSAIVASFIYIL